MTGPGQLGVDEGHGDVAGALGGGEPLVVVRESPGVHEGPALPWGSDGAVVAQEPTTPALGDRKCQFPNRKCQLPRKLGPSPHPLFFHLSPNPAKRPSAQPALDALGNDSHRLPKEVTQSGQESGSPGQVSATPFLTCDQLSLSFPFWKVGIKLHGVPRIQ